VPLAALQTLEEWMDDALLVLNAAGSEKVAVVGNTEGGPMAILLAAGRGCAHVPVGPEPGRALHSARDFDPDPRHPAPGQPALPAGFRKVSGKYDPCRAAR